MRSILIKVREYEDDMLRIQAFGSTDVGISFLIHLQGKSIFHAGDLNNWHWSEESTEQEIRKAEGRLPGRNKISSGSSSDHRPGNVSRRPPNGKRLHERSPTIHRTNKTTIFVPMHFSEDYEGGNAFRSIAEAGGCRFITITHRGESFDI